ncbi:MAG: hypothetical protein P8104_04550 [Gammaproteobacteria bacterium]
MLPEKLNQWLDLNSDKQYTRKLLFSTLYDLMSLVVFQVFFSLNAAYKIQTKTASISLTSIYNKLNGFEPKMAAALARNTSE